MADRSIKTILSLDVSGFKQGLKSAADETRGFQSKAATAMQEHRQQWDQVGGAMVKVGAGLTAFTALQVTAATKWESAWTGVLKTVDGTDEQLDRLQSGLREMARTTLPAAHSEIAGVAEAAGQLGIQTQNVERFTRTMIDMGETTNLSADEAATGMARFANVMGTNQTQFDRMGSTIVALGNNFATTEAEILGMSQRLASAGRVVGLTEAQTFGLATAMSSVGIEAEAGGSAISRVMIKVAGAVDEGGESLDSFAKAANMSSQDFATAWRNDPVSALLAVVGGLAQMTAEGSGTFAMLDELELRDVRVTNAMLSLSNAVDLTTGAVDLANVAWEENTALAEEAELRYGTFESRIGIMRNALVDAAIGLGETLLPVMEFAVDKVTDLANAFGDLPAPVQAGVAGLTAVAGAATLAGGAIMLAAPKYLEGVAALRTLGLVSESTSLSLRGLPASAARFGVLGAAIAGLVVGADKLVSLSVVVPDVERLAGAIDQLVTATNEGERSGAWEQIDALLSGKQDYWGQMTMAADIDGLAAALQNLDLRGRQSFGWLDKISFMNADNQQADNAIQAMNDAFAALLASGDIEATLALYKEWSAAAADAGTQMYMSEENVTGYIAALGEHRTALLEAANSEEALAEAAAQAHTDYAASLGMSAEELAKWREEVFAAGTGFVALGTAYDDAIQANKDFAQSTADATADSSDSWEDYYDGVTVSVDDFIAQLQRQVDAQENWADNLLDLSLQINTQLPEDMRDTANKMVDELVDLGPKGAEQVALFADMSDAELAEVVDLWGRRGEETVLALTDGLEMHRLPDFELNTNFAEAEADARAVAAAVLSIPSNHVARVDIAPRLREVLSAAGGVTAFAAGGIDEGGRPVARVPQIRHAAQGAVMWGERSTGWEAYISGDPAHREDNVKYWAEAGARLGVSVAPQIDYRALASAVTASSSRSSAGLSDSDVARIAVAVRDGAAAGVGAGFGSVGSSVDVMGV